jgi:hypothetical protein
MHPKLLKRNISQLYLTLVPVVTAITGFGVGHISYKIYLPVWIVNVCLMVTTSWILGLNVARKNDDERKQLALGSFFLIIPWMLISIFFGFGPPPENATEWVATATEQQVRYSILIFAGVFVAFGFATVREKLKNNGESFYSNLGFIAITIAIPLFILNMIFWGFFLTESFRILVASASEKMPEWFSPVRKLFGLLSIVEVALTYLAAAAFAASLKYIGWFSKTVSLIYIVLSFLAFSIIVLSAFCPEPFISAGYAVSIPAIPFIMPYFIGISLLKRAGN